MKTLLIVLIIAIVLFILGLIIIKKNKSPKGKSYFEMNGYNKPIETRPYNSQQECEKAGKKWIQPNCIKAPCPGQCI